MFSAKFHNFDTHPIDIIRYNQEWNENLVKSMLGPEEEYSHETYFTTKFFFKRSDTRERMMASANGVTSAVFEGCRFHAQAGRLLFVNISRGNDLISNSLFLSIDQ